MHCLIIEDEAVIAMAIEDVLRECGCTSIDFAYCADEAVAAAMRRCPDLITADVRLAPGSGIDAVEAICADKPIPVVFVTGSEAEVRTRRPDSVVVQKPFDAAQLARVVHSVVGRSDAAAAPPG